MNKTRESNLVGIIGLFIISYSAFVFLYYDWSIIMTFNFLIVSFGVGYLTSKLQKKINKLEDK